MLDISGELSVPAGETLPGALSHHGPCSEKMHLRGAETARRGGLEDGRREKGARCSTEEGTRAVSPPRRTGIFTDKIKWKSAGHYKFINTESCY